MYFDGSYRKPSRAAPPPPQKTYQRQLGLCNLNVKSLLPTEPEVSFGNWKPNGIGVWSTGHQRLQRRMRPQGALEQPTRKTALRPVYKRACANHRWGAGLEGRSLGSMSLRKPRGEVGEGGPCVSVLLFRGGGGSGGQMAAHGGSAASSALKGLIQQFIAITGKRRGYRKVESGVCSGRPVCPSPPFTFMHYSLGLYPQLPSSLLRKRQRRRRVSGFRRQTAPPRTPQTLDLGLPVVWRDTLHLLSTQTRPEPIRARPPRDLGAAEVGGPHPGHRPPSTSLLRASMECSASPDHLLPIFLSLGILPLSLACPSLFWAP